MKSKDRETKTVPAPRLRFKQFEDSGEWEEKNLGDIAMMSSGGTPSSTVSEYYGGSIPWVSISDMTKSGKYLNKTEKKLTQLGLENSAAKIFPENTILFAMYASIGKCNIASLPVSTSQAILGIIPLNGNSTDYIYYFLANNEKKYADMGQHGTQKNLNAGMVKALPIPLPPTFPEQTHIAACLSSLDAVIDAHTDKLAALRQHKRALMQQLFPQEGEKVPRLRFPEFEGAGEWEEKKLGDLGITLGGLTGKAGDDFGSGRPFVTYKQIFDYSTVDFYKCGLVKIQEGERQNTLRLGDVLITMSSETPEEVGYASVIREEPREDTYLNSFSFAFRVNEDVNLDIDFSRHLFHSEPYRKAVIFLAQGVTRFNISKNRFLDLKLPLPPTLPEQTHIAACLSSLDDLISAQSEKIDTLKTFKRGLMQGLFPRGGEA